MNGRGGRGVGKEGTIWHLGTLLAVALGRRRNNQDSAANIERPRYEGTSILYVIACLFLETSVVVAARSIEAQDSTNSEWCRRAEEGN